MNFLAKKSPLERYVADVKSYLPKKNRQDIIDELQVNLSDKFADFSAESGAELSDAAQIKMLSDFGHPLQIAAQYQGGSRSLIGPTLYPFYRMSVLISLVVSTLIIFTLLLAEQVFDFGVGESLGPWTFVNTYITIVGVITMGYGLTEYVIERNHYLDSWQPNALAQPDNVLASAWGALISCIAAVTWLAILSLIDIQNTLTTLVGGNENPIHTLVLWMKIQMLVLIPQYFYLIVNQKWSRERLLLIIGSELILAAGCVVVLLRNIDNLNLIYSELPMFLTYALYYVVWGMIAATSFSAFQYWRKLVRQQAAA